MSTPDKETANLLAELDAEFGKQPKGRRGTGGPADLRSAQDAKAQLERTKYTSFSDWEQHKLMIESNAFSKVADWRPSWIPEAKITYVIRQHCRCCGDTVSFIGGEYIRFQSKKEFATITRRAEVCTDLWHYGWRGEPLADLIDEIDQDVARCPGCIQVEQKALEIWDAIQREEEKKIGNGDQLEIEL